MSKIRTIRAREILDSRGNPTVEVEVLLNDGIQARASVPSGASTGKHEALELRDNDPKRFRGKGALKVCSNVNDVIGPKLIGMDPQKQEEIDELMINLDGTENKSNLGANAILGVSLAVCKAAAKSEGLELFEYIKESSKFKVQSSKLPVPMFNIFNGGKHADTNLDIQEIMIVPIVEGLFKEKVRIGAEIFHTLQEILKTKGLDTDVGSEGGFAPDVNSSEEAMEMILEAVGKSGYQIEKDIGLALDIGASTIYKDKRYNLDLDKLSLTSEELVSLYSQWIKKYHIISIEDPLAEDDWQGWQMMTKKIGDKIQIIGDDLLVTNVKRLKRAIKEKAANGILIKPNQIGTLTETLECIKVAKENGFKTVISHRSGETTDIFISDLATGVNSDYIKSGSLSRGERVCKYNRLMEIEEKIANC